MSKPYTVTRSIEIAAAPERVHSLINDFHEWEAWSPWEDVDPDMSRTYSGPTAGPGAHYTWDGDKKAGAGSMEILTDDPHLVTIALQFSRPFPAKNRIELELTPAGSGTRVEWRLHGDLKGFVRVFALIKPMDSLVGPDFERGLGRLKKIAENAA